MYPRLICVYGPLWIQSYGLMIAVGFLLFLYLTYNHPLRKRIVDGVTYLNIVFFGLLAGIVGGRLLFVMFSWREFVGNWLEIFYPWVGGFIVLGSIVGVLLVIPFYLAKHSIPAFMLLDIAAIYASLFQAVARIGCFFAGCCYGCSASSWLPWRVVFTNPVGVAPLNVPLHPAQIYSSLASLCIFLIIRGMVGCIKFKPGQIMFCYLTLESLSRFCVDFFRGDQTDLIDLSKFAKIFYFQLSSSQVLSFSFFLLSFFCLIYVSLRDKQSRFYMV